MKSLEQDLIHSRVSTTLSSFLLNYAIHFDADFSKCPNPNLNSQYIVYIDT